MRLNLFGGFGLLDGQGKILDIPQKRGQALLGYLALKDSRRESREYIVDLLWPDRFKAQAQASLRQVLFVLRRHAADGPIIVATRGEVALGSAIRECDAWEFEDCINGRELADAALALALYRGPFLDGPPLGPEPYQHWAAIQRARLEGKLDRAVLDVTAAWRERHSNAPALSLLEDLIRHSPLCCEAMLRIMEIDAANGNVGDALRKFERYARRLKLEFDDAPPAELNDAYEVLKSFPIRQSAFRAPRRQLAHGRNDPWRKALHDAPVVAVLPFRCQGQNGQGSALASVICEDITIMLSGCRWFRVLSRSATHGFQPDGPFYPKDFVNRTGADYLVYGALVERDDGWSVTVELADAESGLISWVKRYDASGHDIMRIPSELCPLIVAALDPAIAESERNSLRKPALSATGSIAAYQYLVLGYRHYYAGEW
jgi:DNA-binding SARP family transcriptional activator